MKALATLIMVVRAPALNNSPPFMLLGAVRGLNYVGAKH